MPKHVPNGITLKERDLGSLKQFGQLGQEILVVRESGVRSSTADYYGSMVSFTILEDPNRRVFNEQGIDGRESLTLSPDQFSNTACDFEFTQLESGYVDSPSLKVRGYRTNGSPQSWGETRELPKLDLPGSENTVFLAGLFPEVVTEEVPTGAIKLNPIPNTPFVLEIDTDVDETRIHAPDEQGNWKDLQLFGRTPSSLVERIKVVASTNQGLLAQVSAARTQGSNPEDVIHDAYHVNEVLVDVEGREQIYESGMFFSNEYVVRKTHVPRNCPTIVYLLGPARGGTTALGMLMAGDPNVEWSYFQPHKNGVRHGRRLIIRPSSTTNGVIFMKETFGPLHNHELPLNLNPVESLLEAGVPEDKIIPIVTVRDPKKSFASLTKFTDRMDSGYFGRMQEQTIKLYNNYRQRGLNAVPFSYDLLGDPRGELFVLQSLMNRVGNGLGKNLSLDFDPKALNQKMVWGEAEDPDYFNEVVLPTLSRGRFRYTSNGVDLPQEQVRVLQETCSASYQAFAELAAQELRLA